AAVATTVGRDVYRISITPGVRIGNVGDGAVSATALVGDHITAGRRWQVNRGYIGSILRAYVWRYLETGVVHNRRNVGDGPNGNLKVLENGTKPVIYGDGRQRVKWSPGAVAIPVYGEGNLIGVVAQAHIRDITPHQV